MSQTDKNKTLNPKEKFDLTANNSLDSSIPKLEEEKMSNDPSKKKDSSKKKSGICGIIFCC